MQLFKVVVEQRSGWLTEPTSGVLMGHLMWAYRYLYGEAALVALLKSYRAGGEPPLIASALLPEGRLPRPPLTALKSEDRQALAQARYGSSNASALALLSREIHPLLRAPWIDSAILQQVQHRLTTRTLLDAMLAQAGPDSDARYLSGPGEPKAPASGGLRHYVRTQPSINRRTGQVQEGLLYETTEAHYPPPARLQLWLRIGDEYATEVWLERWRACFRLLEAQGIGKRSTTGRGALRLLANLTPAPGELPEVAQPNGFTSLSSWMPAAADPDAVAYQLETRHGRLGGQYGSSDNVWKYPVTALLPGAVGRLPQGAGLRAWYGHTVEQVHRTRPEIVEFGYCFPLGVRIEEE